MTEPHVCDCDDCSPVPYEDRCRYEKERDEARTLAKQLAESIRRWIAQDEYDYDGLGGAMDAYWTQSQEWPK